ncbi:uncharacterized protein LOC133197673 [Saccostrea echinata]|uniref:uncharacterized protein LOC133197673 n=1 Tax=Saccostrea echinata TaxID=191078 RepID=UPI002A808C60|nr:uncharacterized protein LOC133197673 [Saccostrea echinata]
MAGNSTDANFSEVTVKLERLDQEYEYSNALQTEADTFTNIKTDPSEPDENYSLPTVSQCPPQISGGSQTSFSMPVISSPPIMNRAQLLNGGPNLLSAAQVPPKKQIAALVKVAAPTSTGTTIKQEVDKACFKLSQDGEQSLFLSVNVEKKLCSYVGSDMGRQFLNKRPDIMEHFFQFCQVVYNTEKESKNKSNETAIQSTQKKLKPKPVVKRPNILQQKATPTQQPAKQPIQQPTQPIQQPTQPTQQPIQQSIQQPIQQAIAPALIPVAGNVRGTVPMTGNLLHPIAQPPPGTQLLVLPPAAQTMPEIAKILNTSTVTNIKSIVPQSVESGRKRKKYQKDGPEDEPQQKQPPLPVVDMPFRMNIKKLNSGATKSTLMTLRQSLESKSGTGVNPVIIDKASEASTSTQQPRMISIIQKFGTTKEKSPSYGEVLKEAMKNSLSENSSLLANKFDMTPELTPQEYDLSLIKKEPKTTPPIEKATVDPPFELFSKSIKLSEAPTDIHSLFFSYTTRKVKKMVKRTKKKPVRPNKNSVQEIKENSNSNPIPQEKTDSTPKPYSFRQRTKKKRFGDDYVEDFKEVRTRGKAEMKKEEEEFIDDDNDEDYKAESNEEEEENENNAELDDNDDDDDDENTDEESKPAEDVEEDRTKFKYYDESNLEEFFDDQRHTYNRNRRGDYNCKLCLNTFKWSMTYVQHMVDKHEKLLQNMMVHQCILCEKCFLANEDLAAHYRKVHKQLDCFICKRCNSTFNAAPSYHKHLETCGEKVEETESDEMLFLQPTKEGEKKSTYVCNICLRVLKTAEGLEKHMKMHDDDSYLICDICGVQCTTKTKLNNHKANRHHTKLGKVGCPNCDRRFMTVWAMYRHNQDVHGCTQDICKECGKFFDTEEQLLEHINQFHPHLSQDVSRFSCEECGKWFEQARYLYVHYKEVHRNQRSVCGFCGKGFSNRDEFHAHKKTHDLSIPNTCKICAKTWNTPEDLEKHMRFHVRGKKLHQCDICKDVFIRRQDLIDHMITHTQTFPYICKECGKGFKNKGKLKVHMISHVSHRPFQCDICGMSFKMKATLGTHIKRHKEVKPFKCNYCPLRFKSVEGSRNHMLHKHITPEELKFIKFKVYKCEYCNKLMGQKHMYMRHVRLHTGERPCVCDVCGRSFTMPATLNVHKKTHLERKPHHCDTCNFGFIDAHKLGKHFQTIRHKQMVEQKKRIKQLAETRERNMMKATEDTGVVERVSVKLEEVDDVSILEVPERTQISLGDEMVVVERAADDPLQNERLLQRESSGAVGLLQGYTDTSGNLMSLVSVPGGQYPGLLSQVQQSAELSNQIIAQGVDLANQLIVPKEENMNA